MTIKGFTGFFHGGQNANEIHESGKCGVQK
jgi:hypothetical protein